jgi:hypothetical protein
MESLKKTSFSEVDATLEVLGKHGVTSEGLKAVRKDPNLAAKVALLIMAGLRLIFKVIVDYGLSLDEMIKAGKYDWVSDAIVKHFTPQGEGKRVVDLVLVTVPEILEWLIAEGHASEEQIAGKWVTTKQVFAYFASHGLMAALIEYLLALGATNPELQKHFDLIALGSSYVGNDNGRRSPTLCCENGNRKLHLSWVDDAVRWLDSSRFLAVGK